MRHKQITQAALQELQTRLQKLQGQVAGLQDEAAAPAKLYFKRDGKLIMGVRDALRNCGGGGGGYFRGKWCHLRGGGETVDAADSRKRRVPAGGEKDAPTTQSVGGGE